MFTKATLKKLFKENSNGFTSPIKGKVKRYVVAFTDNEEILLNKEAIDLLKKQAAKYSKIANNINVGGWLDTKTNKYYLDISTSTDDKNLALAIAKNYNQKAIFDLELLKEIRV